MNALANFGGEFRITFAFVVGERNNHGVIALRHKHSGIDGVAQRIFDAFFAEVVVKFMRALSVAVAVNRRRSFFHEPLHVVYRKSCVGEERAEKIFRVAVETLRRRLESFAPIFLTRRRIIHNRPHVERRNVRPSLLDQMLIRTDNQHGEIFFVFKKFAHHRQCRKNFARARRHVENLAIILARPFVDGVLLIIEQFDA